MEDLKISLDLTVRDSKNNIVQFLYGEDGMDAVKIEKQYINTLTMDLQQLYDHYHFINEDFNTYVEAATVPQIIETDTENPLYGSLLPEVETICNEYFNKLLDDKK